MLRGMFSRKSGGDPPVESGGGSTKRPNDGTSNHKSKMHKSSHKKGFEEPRFTFEEVQEMIDKLLSKQTRASPAVSAGLKRVNFEEIACHGHSVQGCKELIEQLVDKTRRVRTLQEVLTDIKENLKKRSYTEIIQRATLKEDLPKKPPSAYLLYHQDRYNELKEENSLAVEVSKIVAEEWKLLPEKKRQKYIQRHDELLRNYEETMSRLGLIDSQAPKKPKGARSIFIEQNLDEMDEKLDKAALARKKEGLGQMFDSLSSSEKQYWINKQKEMQERYKVELERYVTAHPHLNHAVPEKKTRSDKIKPPEPPKSAVKFFIQRKMPDNLEGQAYDETKKRLKEKFTRLSEKKQLKYIKKAIQDKERYEHEVEQFKKANPDKEVAKTKANISKDQWKLYSRVVENRPTLPAPNAYLYYCGKLLTDMNDNDDEQAPTARMQAASVRWKKSPDWEKQQAEREHLADIQRYVHEMDAWLAKQTDERKMQIFSEEPKANPDIWRKKLNRIKKLEKKRKNQENDYDY